MLTLAFQLTDKPITAEQAVDAAAGFPPFEILYFPAASSNASWLLATTEAICGEPLAIAEPLPSMGRNPERKPAFAGREGRSIDVTFQTLSD